MDIKEAAAKAADYIDRYGFRKYFIGKPGQPACIRGAIMWSMDTDDVYGEYGEETLNEAPVLNAVCDKLGLKYYKYNWFREPKLSAVVVWNNAEERTKEDVTTVLREVANS